MNLEGGIILLQLIAAATALVFGVLGLVYCDRSTTTAKRFPSHLFVVTQALMGVFFVGWLAKALVRPPSVTIGWIATIASFVYVVVILVLHAFYYWKLFQHCFRSR